jgi:hypothetical protein
MHVHIHFFVLRMADTVTSHNIDLSSWDTLYSLTYCRCRDMSHGPFIENIEKTTRKYGLQRVLYCDGETNVACIAKGWSVLPFIVTLWKKHFIVVH